MSAKNTNERQGVTKKILVAAAESLERYSEVSDTFTDCVPMVIGSGTPFDCALVPFDLVANGGRVCDDKKLLDRFAGDWVGALKVFKCDGSGECFLSLVRVLKMFSLAGRSDFNLGVFVADYGFFRGALTKCLYWHTSKIGGGSAGIMSDVIEASKNILELEKKNRRALLAARNAKLIAKGEWTDDDFCNAQIDNAIARYQVEKSKSLSSVLMEVLNMKMIDGHEVKGDVGFVKDCLEKGRCVRDKKGCIRASGRQLGASNFYKRVYRQLENLGKLRKR